MGLSYLITGGTGSFGRAYLADLLRDDYTHRVVIYSRDEAKQAEMRQRVTDPRVRFVIGDVRDTDRLTHAMRGVQTIVHAAAMKRVEACEVAPDECYAVNTQGTHSALKAALVNPSVIQFLLLSTDKAAAPNTAYGFSKAMAERLVWWANCIGGPKGQRFACTRYGNVMGSTGSIVPTLRAFLARGEPFPITDPDMTRFWMPMSQAVSLVNTALGHMRGGEVYVPTLRAIRLGNLAHMVAPGHPWTIMGMRPMEKLNECLITPDEMRQTYRLKDSTYVIMPHSTPWTDRPMASEAEKVTTGQPYTSDRAPRWTDEEIAAHLENF